MGEIYGSRWTTTQGRIVNDDGFATDTFTNWCEGTAHLDAENWLYGLQRIDQKMRADAAHNRDSFPPETPAQWCSWCFPPEVPANQRVSTAGQSKISHTAFDDPDHPMNDPDSPSYVPKRIGIESDTHKAKRLEKGNSAIKNMLEGL